MPAARMATRTCPGTSSAASNVSRRRFSGGPSTRQTTGFRHQAARGFQAFQRFADQRHAVVAEIHVGLADKDRRRTETTTRHHLIGIGLELILDRLLADALEELDLIDARFLADLRQHEFLRDILVAAPIGLEHGSGERNHILAKPDAAAHRFDAVHRKYRGRHLDRKAGGARPVGEILFHVARLQWHRRLARGVDAGVYGIQDAAYQDRAPTDFDAELLGERLDVVEGERSRDWNSRRRIRSWGFPLLSDFHSYQNRHCEERSDEAIQTCFAAPTIASLSLLANDARWEHVTYFPAISLARGPNIFRRASSSNGSLTNLPIASPACTCGRARTSVYQRLTFWIIVQRKALRLVGHSPGEAGDIGDRIVASDIGARSHPIAYPERGRAVPPRRGNARSHTGSSPPHRARNGRAGRAWARAHSFATSATP